MVAELDLLFQECVCNKSPISKSSIVLTFFILRQRLC